MHRFAARRRQGLLATLAVLALPPALRAQPEGSGPAVRWPTVGLLDGSRFGPEQALDHAVIVVFWSTSCPFCRNHNPHVEKLHRAAAGQRLRVLTAALDRDAGLVRSHAAQRGYSFPITLESDTLAAALGARKVIPLTVVVDRQGRQRQAYPGEMFEEDVMELLRWARA